MILTCRNKNSFYKRCDINVIRNVAELDEVYYPVRGSLKG